MNEKCDKSRRSIAMAFDPVSGMTVNERSPASARVPEGKTHCFCSTGRKPKIEADPAGRLKTTVPVNALNHANETEPRNIPYLIWSGLTLATCPCCIPIWIIVLSGTAAGALLSKNIYISGAVFLVLFVFSAWRALRSYNRNRIQG